jgi:hypothetical protein
VLNLCILIAATAARHYALRVISVNQTMKRAVIGTSVGWITVSGAHVRDSYLGSGSGWVGM